MPTKTQKVKGLKVLVQTDPLALVKDKLKRLKELQTEIVQLHAKYKEHDQIVTELLPMFIERQADKFVIHREITLGSEKVRFNPSFFDEKKGLISAKVWKSTAFPTGSIE